MSIAALVKEAAPAGFDQQQNANITIDPTSRQEIAASSTDVALGVGGGAVGDYISGLILVVATAATAAVSVKDGGGSAISVFPNNPGGGIGTYFVPALGPSFVGPWTITTGAGVSVIARGRFS